MIPSPELFGNLTSSHAVAKQEELAKNDEFGLPKNLCTYFEGIFDMPFIITTLGLRLYFPPKEGVLRIFIALKNPSPSTGFRSYN
jgi:hypothetical protein